MSEERHIECLGIGFYDWTQPLPRDDEEIRVLLRRFNVCGEGTERLDYALKHGVLSAQRYESGIMIYAEFSALHAVDFKLRFT